MATVACTCGCHKTFCVTLQSNALLQRQACSRSGHGRHFLWHQAVTQRERELALHLYHYQRSGVMQSIAFGKRVDTPLETTAGSSRCTQPARRVMMPSGSEFGNQRNKEPFENPEDAVLLRAMARSVMEFSYVDWNNVATSQERRLENKAAAEACKKLTVQFR
ncbi:leucine-rich repeat-containing protein 72 [Pezoporus occidentalis]|uniref:leucine-rich repeat-containing protein 72 n=1 Tax=Pezoporus occidentalis TaxID=407982 RepID=UPI002F918702